MIINDDPLESHTMYPSGQAFCIRGFESRHCVFMKLVIPLSLEVSFALSKYAD